MGVSANATLLLSSTPVVQYIDLSLSGCGSFLEVVGLEMIRLANGWETVGAEIPLILVVSQQDSHQRKVGPLLGLYWQLLSQQCSTDVSYRRPRWDDN